MLTSDGNVTMQIVKADMGNMSATGSPRRRSTAYSMRDRTSSSWRTLGWKLKYAASIHSALGFS